ncbi:MAG: hypothetical protein ACI4ED_04260 [Suilimivivens sp.]
MKTEYPFYEIKYELNTVKDVVEVTAKSYRDNPVFRFKEGKEIRER